MKKSILDYDSEEDILFVHREDSKSKGSVEVMGGDVILDVSKEKEVVGIEILNASEILKPYDIDKGMLKEATTASLKTSQHRNTLFLTLLLTFSQKKEKEVVLTVPSLASPQSPVTAAA